MTPRMDIPGQIPLRTDLDRDTFEAEVVPAAQPVVLKGLVRDWPLVRAGQNSPGALAQAIKAFDAGREPFVIEAPAQADGRIFYRDDLAGFNFTRRPASIGATLDRLLQFSTAPDAPAFTT